MSTTGISPLLMLAAIFISSVACVDRATDQQIEAACRNLTKIAPATEGDVASQLNKCQRDLEREGVSASAAQCRAEASDTDNFWNRCRR
jgi:hypothetical protein